MFTRKLYYILRRDYAPLLIPGRKNGTAPVCGCGEAKGCTPIVVPAGDCPIVLNPSGTEPGVATTGGGLMAVGTCAAGAGAVDTRAGATETLLDAGFWATTAFCKAAAKAGRNAALAL